MEALSKHISDRLETHPYCTVYESKLSISFPVDKKLMEKRMAAIEQFAKEHGWSVTITDPGLRATFRKL